MRGRVEFWTFRRRPPIRSIPTVLVEERRNALHVWLLLLQVARKGDEGSRRSGWDLPGFHRDFGIRYMFLVATESICCPVRDCERSYATVLRAEDLVF